MSKLTVDDIMSSSGRFPERAKHKEATAAVKSNATELARRVNGLLDDMGWTGKRESTSGFRPSDVNAGIANAAKKSLHMEGKANDLLDDLQQTLAYAIMARPDLLIKWKLWLEHPEDTRGKNTNWAHLDISETRKDRPIRVFRV